MSASLRRVGMAATAIAVVGTIALLAFLFGMLAPANASQSHGYLPAWIHGTRCTAREARSMHVAPRDCVNFTHARITLTRRNGRFTVWDS